LKFTTSSLLLFVVQQLQQIVRLISGLRGGEGLLHTLKLANSILNGGNSSAQQALIDYLVISNNEDRFFKKIKEKIEKFLMQLKQQILISKAQYDTSLPFPFSSHSLPFPESM
jgi:hypothetical protein